MQRLDPVLAKSFFIHHPSSFSLLETGIFKDSTWQEWWRGQSFTSVSWSPCHCGRDKGRLFVFVNLWNGNTTCVFRDAISLVHVWVYLLFKVMTCPNPDLDSLLLLCLGRFKGIFLYTLEELFFIFSWKLQNAISISNKHPRCCAFFWHAFHSLVSLQGMHQAGQRNYLFYINNIELCDPAAWIIEVPTVIPWIQGPCSRIAFLPLVQF